MYFTRRVIPILVAAALLLATAAPALADTSYVVQPGDTLAGIASRFGVSARAIINANPALRKHPDLMYAGQTLVIPSVESNAAPAAVAPAAVASPEAAAPAPIPAGTYVVQRGDTLASIAAKFGVSVREIINGNSALRKNPNLLYAGSTINIPGLAASASSPAPAPSGPASAFPYLSNITSRAREIYLAGQALGNRANVFSAVGDSITVAPSYLRPLGDGRAQFGDYAYLQAVTQFFAAGSARSGLSSFAYRPIAAANGWSAWTTLTPYYSDHTACAAGEAPIQCEYRVVKPAIAIIMFGTNDAVDNRPESFRANLASLVDISIQSGVIPVLSTIPDRYLGDIPRDRPLAFNDLIRDVAHSRGVPVWDYWASLQNLPNHGIGDTVHPSIPSNGNAADFTGEGLAYGYTVRNLGTLIVLDTLWRSVMN